MSVIARTLHGDVAGPLLFSRDESDRAPGGFYIRTMKDRERRAGFGLFEEASSRGRRQSCTSSTGAQPKSEGQGSQIFPPAANEGESYSQGCRPETLLLQPGLPPQDCPAL